MQFWSRVSFFRTNVLITVAKTMQPVKLVLQTRDTAVCVLLDLREIIVRLVSFWGNTELRLINANTSRSLRSVTVSSVKNVHCAALCYVLNEQEAKPCSVAFNFGNFWPFRREFSAFYVRATFSFQRIFIRQNRFSFFFLRNSLYFI